jgi:hypothetical protein
MASLYERLAGVHPTRSKIPIHQFQSIIAEWARGNMTGAEANTNIAGVSGLALDATETLEAQDLVATVPTGNTAALQAARALKLIEIDQVLMLAEVTVGAGIAPLSSTAAVRTRLGVQTR